MPSSLADILASDPSLVWNPEANMGTDKGSQHSYVEYYDEVLAKYRNESVRVVEIGADSGGSLALWSKYFSKASILGIDCEDKVIPRWRNLPGVSLVVADAYTSGTAESVGEFDVLIDDGPHSLESMRLCLSLYLPRMKKGGLMVIEDVPDINWCGDLLGRIPSEYASRVLDLRHVKGRWDDILIEVTRKS